MNDVIFKIVFGKQQNEPVLRALLNSLLQLSGAQRITALTLLNPYLDKEYIGSKGVVLDVKARDASGQLYNVEVQLTDEPDYIQRSLYYLTRLFSEQIERGDRYGEINRTIAISIVDFVLFPDREDLQSVFHMRDASGRQLSDILEIHYIELIKFKGNKPHKLRTPFERWLHVLKFGELYERELEPLPASLRNEEGIEDAMSHMRKARASDEVREMIWMREKALLDEGSRLSHAKKAGEANGEANAAARIARKLLDSGVDADTIYRATGLRVEDLK